jgi:hypothetical protein
VLSSLAASPRSPQPWSGEWSPPRTGWSEVPADRF